MSSRDIFFLDQSQFARHRILGGGKPAFVYVHGFLPTFSLSLLRVACRPSEMETMPGGTMGKGGGGL
jgi:hypothetical protein